MTGKLSLIFHRRLDGQRLLFDMPKQKCRPLIAGKFLWSRKHCFQMSDKFSNILIAILIFKKESVFEWQFKFQMCFLYVFMYVYFIYKIYVRVCICIKNVNYKHVDFRIIILAMRVLFEKSPLLSLFTNLKRRIDK